MFRADLCASLRCLPYARNLFSGPISLSRMQTSFCYKSRPSLTVLWFEFRRVSAGVQSMIYCYRVGERFSLIVEEVSGSRQHAPSILPYTLTFPHPCCPPIFLSSLSPPCFSLVSQQRFHFGSIFSSFLALQTSLWNTRKLTRCVLAIDAIVLCNSSVCI